MVHPTNPSTGRPHGVLFPLLVGASLMLVASLPASQLGGEWRVHGNFPGATGEHFGYSVASAGDVDADGIPDLIVGAPYAVVAGQPWAGSAFVYSGANGALLWRFDGTYGDTFGRSVAGVGDLDGDGHADLLIGSPYSDPATGSTAGSAFVYSGGDGHLIFRFDGDGLGDSMGFAVAAAGDVDADGIPDLLVGVRYEGPGANSTMGAVHVYSGFDGHLLHQIPGSYGILQGWSVAGVGDLDQDGHADFAAGAVGDILYSGSVTVWSGSTGQVLWKSYGRAVYDDFGWSVAPLPDSNGDGLPEVLVGAPYADPNGYSFGGSVYVLSGADGAELLRLDASASSEYFGRSVAGVGDLDADGLPEILVGADMADTPSLTDAGAARLYSGASGTLLNEFQGDSASARLGFSVAGIGDLNGDGLEELAVGAYLDDPQGRTDAGCVELIQRDPYLALDPAALPAAAGGSVTLSIDFPDDEDGVNYQLLLSETGTGPSSWSGIQVPLTSDRLFVLSGQGSYPIPITGAIGVLDGNGDAIASASVAPGLLLSVVGREYWCAAVSFDASGGRLSSAARRVTILP